MGKKYFFYILFLSAICIVSAGCERTPSREKHHRIGIINPSAALEKTVKGFKQGMKEFGYKEGENTTYIYDGPLSGINQVDAIAKDMVAKNVDLIFSLTTPGTKRVKSVVAGTNIPVVFAPVYSPETSGIVESLAAPGGNITGVKVRGSTAKALGLLHETIPGMRRIFVPFHMTDDAACMTVADLKEAAAKLNVEVVTDDLTTSDELKAVLAAIPEDVDALFLTCSHLLYSHVDIIVSAAMARKLPVASTTYLYHSGVLLSYGADYSRMGEQTSRLADKILHGLLPADLPVETADYFLGINLRTANALGIHVPDDILIQADFIER